MLLESGDTGNSPWSEACWQGRAYFDAPEIDGAMWLATVRPHKAGDMVKVKITAAAPYDLLSQER